MYKILFFLLFSFIFLPFSFAEDKKEALQEVKDFSFVQYKDGGEQKWRLNGKSAEVVDNKVNIEYISALSLDQGTMLKLKAKQGSFNKGEHLVHLKDNVTALATDGTRLTTDYLEWNAEAKNIYTDAPVNIKRLNMDVKGKGAICDLKAKTAELKQDINATIKSSEPDILRTTPVRRSLGEGGNDERRPKGVPSEVEGRTTILCDGPLELNYKKNRAVFHKNVKVEDSRGTILAERIDVYFNPATRRIKCVVARGDVRIINGENVTYSNKAIYLVDQGRVILPNRPKLVIQNQGNK